MATVDLSSEKKKGDAAIVSFLSSLWKRRSIFIYTFVLGYILVSVRRLQRPTTAHAGSNLHDKIEEDHKGKDPDDTSQSTGDGSDDFPLLDFWIPHNRSMVHRHRVQVGMGPNNSAAEFWHKTRCSPTAQVQILTTHPFWTLRTFDELGNAKTVGGDEFYVMFHAAQSSSSSQSDAKKNGNTPTAVAEMRDLGDGTYLLDFVRPPLTSSSISSSHANGTMTVHFLYTCGIGLLGHPSKQSWKSAGAVLAVAKAPVVGPPMRSFPPPELPTESSLRLRHYDLVISFGDSLMEQFVSTYTHGDISRKRFFRSKLKWAHNVGLPLNTTTVNIFLSKLDQWHGPQLRKQQKTALILGSGVWDVLTHGKTSGHTAADSLSLLPTLLHSDTEEMLVSQRHNFFELEFADHLLALQRFLSLVHDHYPSVKLYWKSPTCLHIHRLRHLQKKLTVRRYMTYMSHSRIAALHQLQREILTKHNIPVLDVYEATFLAATWTNFGDARHYQDDVFEQAIDWFY